MDQILEEKKVWLKMRRLAKAFQENEDVLVLPFKKSLKIDILCSVAFSSNLVRCLG